MNGKTNWADVLPNDRKLRERSGKWSEVLDKFKDIEEDESLNLRIDESLSIFLDEREPQSDEESVTVSEFEDNTAKEDDFDVEDALNQTKQIIEKRKDSWNQSGFGYMLDSFTFDNIANRVDSWLTNNCDFFSSKFVRNVDRNCSNGEKLDQGTILKTTDDFSDSSVDTAKYILSNRKRQKSKVTMTIKQFCYSSQNNVAARQFHLEKIISGDDTIRNALTTGRNSYNHQNLRLKKGSHTPLPKKHDTTKRKHYSRVLFSSSSSTSSEIVQKPIRKVIKKQQTPRKITRLRDELDSCSNEDEKEFSPHKCRKRLKNLKSRSLPKKISPKSVGLAKGPRSNFDSDQSREVSPKIKMKVKKDKYKSEESYDEQTIRSNKLEKKDKDSRKFSEENVASPDHQKNNKIHEVSFSPRMEAKKDSLMHKTQKPHAQKKKSVTHTTHAPKSPLSDCFIVESEEIQSTVNKTQTPHKKLDSSRVPDNFSKNQGQKNRPHVLLEKQKILEPLNRKVLSKSKPVSQRRHTDVNFTSTGNLSASVSDFNLTHNGVINSTAIKSQDSMIHCKQNFESICNNLVESVNSHRKNIQDNTISSCDSGRRSSSASILLYSPRPNQLPKRTSESGKVIITENDLEDNLGSLLKNRFLGDRREFHYECHANSKLIFIPPADNNLDAATSESEEDPIETMARSEKGKIIEIVDLSSVNRNE